MSVPVILRRIAQREFDRAADWYEDQRSGLGAAFTRTVGSALAAIGSDPDRYGVVHGDVHEALVPWYPFAIYYRTEPARVVVVAVFHTSRDPEEWQAARDDGHVDSKSGGAGPMTEAEWLVCDDPVTMLTALGESVGARKVQLFAVACCNSEELWAALRLPDGDSRAQDYRNAVEVAERYADGLATENELTDAHWMADRSVLYMGAECPSDPFMDLTRGDPAEVAIVPLRVQQAFIDLVPWSLEDPRPNRAEVKAARERVAQSHLLRDIFDNPFRPVAFSPEWRTSTVIALAQQMYESRDFSAMPILADALQDAACDSAEVLDHCRGPGPHVRGCWVVDLVLGKE